MGNERQPAGLGVSHHCQGCWSSRPVVRKLGPWSFPCMCVSSRAKGRLRLAWCRDILVSVHSAYIGGPSRDMQRTDESPGRRLRRSKSDERDEMSGTRCCPPPIGEAHTLWHFETSMLLRTAGRATCLEWCNIAWVRPRIVGLKSPTQDRGTSSRACTSSVCGR